MDESKKRYARAVALYLSSALGIFGGYLFGDLAAPIIGHRVAVILGAMLGGAMCGLSLYLGARVWPK